MASVGEVVAVLKAAVDQLPFAALADALDLAEDAKALIAVAATGSGQDEFFQVLDWFDKTTEGIAKLQQRLTAIQQATTEAINRLEGHGGGPQTVGTQGQPAGNPEPAVAVPQPASGQVHGPIHSGRGELREQAVMTLRKLGLAPARGTLAVADHVEVQVAIQVQEASIADATLAVNNRPCDAGPLSCDRIVPRVLRPGQRLTVHWPGGIKTYTGKDR